MGPCLHGQPSDRCLGEMPKTAGENTKANPSKSYSKNPNSDAEKGLLRVRAGIKEVKVLILFVCQLFLKAHVYKTTVYVFCSVLHIQSVSSPQLPGPDASR